MTFCIGFRDCGHQSTWCDIISKMSLSKSRRTQRPGGTHANVVALGRRYLAMWNWTWYCIFDTRYLHSSGITKLASLNVLELLKARGTRSRSPVKGYKFLAGNSYPWRSEMHILLWSRNISRPLYFNLLLPLVILVKYTRYFCIIQHLYFQFASLPHFSIRSLISYTFVLWNAPTSHYYNLRILRFYN